MYKIVPVWKREPVRVLSLFGDIRKGECGDARGHTLIAPARARPTGSWVCGVCSVPSTTLDEWGSSRQLGRSVISRGVGAGQDVQEPWSSLLQKMGLGKNMHMADIKCCY